ncbi:LacI family DNA-binding transcriptional regulator [Kineococcus sp. G2]|uniref:LacI family DNA-binding transcriptional regulator n=1 Tax=Kineococcus sp. G2 TaxID=3127484 RepID=UPI00301D91C5
MSESETRPSGGVTSPRPALRRPTLKDVAARAGVSKGLASLALRGVPGPNPQTARRVVAAAAELGYRADRAATALALHRSRLLGVTLSVRNAFHAEMVEAIQETAEDAGYEVVLSAVTRRRGERGAVETLLDSRCEALLLLGPELPEPELVELDARTPVVVVGRRTGGGLTSTGAGRRSAASTHGQGGGGGGSSGRLDVVRTADETGIAAAVEHLAALGHRRIAHVSGGPGRIAEDREHGFLTTTAALDLSRHCFVLRGSSSEEAGAVAGRSLLRSRQQGRELPTAVVCFNDRVAVGLIDVLVRAGVEVPARVSVVGYDDSDLARLGHVQLTSVSQEPVTQARHAVEAALERIDGGREEHRQIVLAPRLVVRASTAAARE